MNSSGTIQGQNRSCLGGENKTLQKQSVDEGVMKTNSIFVLIMFVIMQLVCP